MNLSSVSLGIKTFLRDDKLFNTISAVTGMLPEVRMIIADCGEHTEEKDGVYADLERGGHKIIYLPFDAGFGAMSNAIADAVETPYLLIGSDDFDFSPVDVRIGIERLTDVLNLTDLHVASGRVRGPYEMTLEDLGDTIIEHRLSATAMRIITTQGVIYLPCDLTVNYSLIRRDVFQKVRWDNDVKIGGGEHGAFFVDLKRAGFRVAYVPGVEIREQSGEDSTRYKMYRSRAISSLRPCFDRRGIRKYVLAGGRIDYEKLEYPEPRTR